MSELWIYYVIFVGATSGIFILRSWKVKKVFSFVVFNLLIRLNTDILKEILENLGQSL